MTDVDAAGPRTLIARTLGDAGLSFEWQDAAPVAVFSVQLANRPRLTLSARHAGDVFQLIAHRILPGPGDAQGLADRDMLNQEWGLGRVYFNEREGAWDASVGLHAARRSVPANELLATIASLADAPDLIAKGAPPALVVEPRRTPSEVMPSVEHALTAAGLNPKPEHAGEVMSHVLQLDTSRTRIDWFVANGTLLLARARPLSAPRVNIDAGVLTRLNALNGRLDIGAVGLWYEHGIAYGWIGHPLLWFELTPETVRWTAERAASWAEAAQAAASGSTGP